MVTAVQQNLAAASAQYAASFAHGGLALPPAKKYLVRMYIRSPDPFPQTHKKQLSI